MTKQETFISQIAPYIVKQCALLGYKYPSAIIAQAALESGWGKSKLAATYHNYFGLKCGSSWKGASVNLNTMEEYTVGNLTLIKDNFRVYADMAAGVAGYFDFIGSKRYANLKQAISSRNYLELIKADGYATSSHYVDNVYTVVEKYGLRYYDVCIGEVTTELPDTSVSASEAHLDTDLDTAVTIIALRVIHGDFGQGHDHRASEIYKLIRAKVNELC